MPPAFKARAKKLVLIVLSVWSIWSLASPQTVTTLAREQFTKRLVAAAVERTQHPVHYVSDYVRIPYPTVMSRQTPEFVPMRSFGPTVQWGLTCRRKSTKTWFGTSPPTRTRNAGGSIIPIPASTTAACLISWFSFEARERLSLLRIEQQTMLPAISLPGTWAEVYRILASLWIRTPAGATDTKWCTTSEQAQKWRTFYLVGRLLATTDTSGRTVPNNSI
jgi:hypothetical protein